MSNSNIISFSDLRTIPVEGGITLRNIIDEYIDFTNKCKFNTTTVCKCSC